MGLKGFMFSMDAFFAITLLVLGLILTSTMFISENRGSNLLHISEDLTVALSTIKIYELNDPYVDELIANGTIKNTNSTILEQIGEFWATNQTEYAIYLSRNLTEGLVADNIGYGIYAGGDELYARNITQIGPLIPARKMVSGIEKGKPVLGATAQAYLIGLSGKRTNSYAYFGGFEGQGNITKKLIGIPIDANISSMSLKVESLGDFDIYINDVQCGGTYTPSGTEMVADIFDLSSCSGLMNLGSDNVFTFNFTDEINESYFAGGFIRVRYATEDTGSGPTGNLVEWLPGIDGIVNLYSSFYIPGNLTSMHVHLNFTSNETTTMWIGERKILEQLGSVSAQVVDLYDNYLTNFSEGNLDYQQLSNQTTPLRLYSFSVFKQVVTGGDADVVIITDFSGSMKKAVDSWEQGNLGPDCNNYNASPDVRRTRAATCLDQEMVDIVMNYSGNRIWPVFMHDDEIKWFNDPSNQAAINSYIDGYANGKDKTCIPCALNMAYDILESFSNSSRKKVIVMMTDGTATHCPAGGCYSNNTDYGTKLCEGLCDFQGACDAGDIPNLCTECTTNDDASKAAVYAANRTFVDLNATIFTVGFGPMDSCAIGEDTLQTMANITNGTYQHSANITELIDIYHNISYEILSRITLSSQTVSVEGNLSPSRLSPDSFVQFSYDPYVADLEFGEIAFTLETPEFIGCNDSVSIYDEMRVLDSKVASFSGKHWTDELVVNNVTVYNLSDYFLAYVFLGDPFTVQVPAYLMQSGTNVSLNLKTGDNSTTNTGCSLNNSMIYTVAIKPSSSYSPVLETADGCLWTIEFEDGSLINLSIPLTYSGSKECSYTASNVSYDTNDAVDAAVMTLLDYLDFNDDNRSNINIFESDMTVNALWVPRVPYMWGPSVVEVRAWQ